MRYRQAALLLTLTGCQAITWHDVPPFPNQQAQASDGFAESAVVLQSYQVNQAAARNPGSLLGAARHYQHQVMLEGANGQRALTAKRPGKDEPGSLYYVREAGYVMLGASQPDSGTDKVRYEKISLSNGQASLIRESQGGSQVSLCQNRAPAFVVERLLPAPGGKTLAHVFSPACGIANVEFLDAVQFSVLDRQEIPIKAVSETQWHGQGLKIYEIQEAGRGWQVQPGHPAAPLDTGVSP